MSESTKEILCNSTKPEYIICAAVHFDDGKKHGHQPNNIETGFVISGRRHHNCYITAFILNKNAGKDLHEAGGKSIQGFLTSKDRFIDRKEAGRIAFDQQQTNKETLRLFSEDLY
jgi:hypothetical protein